MLTSEVEFNRMISGDFSFKYKEIQSLLAGLFHDRTFNWIIFRFDLLTNSISPAAILSTVQTVVRQQGCGTGEVGNMGIHRGWDAVVCDRVGAEIVIE